MNRDLRVSIEVGHLFMLAIAAHQCVVDHPDNPNIEAINAAIDAATEAQKAAMNR